MKSKLLLLTLSLLAGNFIFAQDAFFQFSGILRDERSQDPIESATISIRDRNEVTKTDLNGNFVLKTINKFPFTLVVSKQGYNSTEFVVENEKSIVSIQLERQVLLNEIVVSASRVSESQLKSPVAIDKLDLQTIRETSSSNYYDALENVKGVQLTTSSLSLKVPNTRGFNSPNNFRFMQLVDGVDLQAPTLGVSIGSTIGPSELDIKSIEIIPGSSSALYGINSLNGLANLQTKDPYLTEGVSVYQRTAINHVDNKDHGLSFMSETAFRLADVVDSARRFAYKIDGSYFQGVDWVSSSSTDQNPYNLKSSNPSYPQFNSAESNPAYDAWNKYGDERNNTVTDTLFVGSQKQIYNVRRTGYWEKDLVDPVVKTAKFGGNLNYKFNDKSKISYTYRIGNMDGVFQRGNKIQLKNAQIQSHAVEYKNSKLTAKLYVNSETTGSSYNLKPLSDNLDLTFKNNKKWAKDYQTALNDAYNANGGDLVAAHQAAREVADAGRPAPGTPEFDALKQTIIGINNWDHPSIYPYVSAQDSTNTTGGAALWQKSRMYHGEAQYDLSSLTKNVVNILVGADARVYSVTPDGNNFVDFSKPIAERNTTGGNNVLYSKFGGFVQTSKEFFDSKLKVVGSLRYDKNLDFEGKWNPRLAIVYSSNQNNAIRFSAQNGYRFPALFEALSYVNNGGVRRVGGLEKINDGLGYLENSYTQSSIDAFQAAVNAEIKAGSTKDQAISNQRGLLQISNLQKMQPEQIKALDLGYKSVLFNNKLIIDADVYFNEYKNFLGQVEVAVPTTDVVGTLASAYDANDKSKQVRYRVYTNATNTYYAYGTAIKIAYNFFKKFSVSGNFNFNDFKAKEATDIFTTGFNTPKYSANIQFGNREILKNVGFNVVWKWQDAYEWQSPLANGNVPAFQTFDAQVTYKLEKAKTTVKVGGTNIFNNRYIQYAAGPTIGGIYYVSLTFDAPFKNK